MAMRACEWLSRGLLAGALLLGLPVAPALAQSDEADGVTGRLIELLVKKGVLPRDEADALLREAKAEKAKPAKPAAKLKEATAAPTTAAPEEPAVAPGTVRVTYVPQIVRDQIAEQVRSQLMVPTSKNGGFAEPPPQPDALSRFHFFGDIRLRGEADQFPSGNSPGFFDFATINGGSPFDANLTSGNPPLLDTTENRSRMRLRVRAGVDVTIDDGLSAEVRLATGNDASPVSANQTFAQNGAFTKYAVWLDRAFIKEVPTDWVTLVAGRMDNPFWTTDLIYYDDLGFDGFAASATPRLSKTLKGFFSAGAFPVFNTAFNFSSTQSYASRDAWLFAAQGGGEWQATKDIMAKFAAGYFSYSNVSGKISSPCVIEFSSDGCDSDNTRLLFPGTGNTMMPLRDITSAPGSTAPQYYGLASPFRILDLHERVNFDMFQPIGVALETEFAVNVAFDRESAINNGVNNFSGTAKSPGPVSAGNKAWMVKVSVGKPVIAERWDWNASLTYKYLESDSVLAALNDPDFHLGGTNAKGFILGGNLGVARNTWITARWLSSTQVSGQPYSVDVFQADLNVKF
jgi:hypothetical protein